MNDSVAMFKMDVGFLCSDCSMVPTKTLVEDPCSQV